MRIDIGTGKILGTKRVSPNGQISGFSEYAGKEVLVVLPNEEPRVELAASDLIHEIEYATRQQMHVAFQRYKGLQEKFRSPEQAARHFLESHTPTSFRNLLESIETWTEGQVERGKKAAKKIRKEA